jgi:hypothetical protein
MPAQAVYTHPGIRFFVVSDANTDSLPRINSVPEVGTGSEPTIPIVIGRRGKMLIFSLALSIIGALALAGVSSINTASPTMPEKSSANG